MKADAKEQFIVSAQGIVNFGGELSIGVQSGVDLDNLSGFKWKIVWNLHPPIFRWPSKWTVFQPQSASSPKRSRNNAKRSNFRQKVEPVSSRHATGDVEKLNWSPNEQVPESTRPRNTVRGQIESIRR